MRKTLLPIFLLIASILQAQTIVINEVDADNPSTDTLEFIELKTASPNMSLDGYCVVLFNGSDDASYESFDLDGYTSDANGLFVLGTSTLSPSPNFTFSKSDNVIQNGADAVAVYQDDASNFPNDTPLTTTNLIDAFVYDTNDGNDSGLLTGLGVSVQYNEGENGNKDGHSNQRKADETYEAKEPTPGVLNDGSGVTTTGITISTSATEYNEGDVFDITFTTSENVSSDLDIDYTLVYGNFDTNDYTGSLSATISSGTNTTSVTITIVDDSDDEGNETLIVKYNNLDSNYQAQNDNYSITIIDNDFATSAWGTPLNPTYDVVSSTAPSDYYASLDGKSGQDLKNAITDLIANSNTVRAQTYGDVWDIVREADVNPLNNNEVWLLYSEEGRDKSLQQGSSGGSGFWNREHIYPQSRGGFNGGTSTSKDGVNVYMSTDSGTTAHAHSDAHGIRPADSGENSSRSNKDYGDDYSGPTGNSGSWKGDVARAVMFMALRYDALDVVNGDLDNSTVGQLGDLASLLTWNSQDKPDDYEMNRNNVVYTWQQNRNPFIDLPELADYVFGDKYGQTWNSSLGVEDYVVEFKAYPNPVVDVVTFDRNIDGIFKLYSFDGRQVLTTKTKSKHIDLSEVASGIYIFIIETKQGLSQGKIVKK